jgi:hypothetical protein
VALFDHAVGWLRRNRVLLPGVTVLARQVAAAREAAEARLSEVLAAAARQVNPGLLHRLADLLQVPDERPVSALERLRQSPRCSSGPRWSRRCGVRWSADTPSWPRLYCSSPASSTGSDADSPKETDMELTIVNPHPKYSRVGLIEPPPTGYLLLAAVVEPTVGRTPFPRGGPRKAALLFDLKQLAARLERLETVTKATVYRAALIPPPSSDARRLTTRPARYDVVALVETATVDASSKVEVDAEFQKLHDTLTGAAREDYMMRACCLRRVGDVDKTRQGLFLFNFFVAEDPGVALELWDHLAAWYAVETGMDNSTLLGPIGPADYAFVNHARWDISLPRFAAKQFSKRTFYTYVLANLHANRTASMPIFYHLA